MVNCQHLVWFVYIPAGLGAAAINGVKVQQNAPFGVNVFIKHKETFLDMLYEHCSRMGSTIRNSP